MQARHGVTTASLAAEAARGALAASGTQPGEVELIVVGTTSPDVLWPSTACLVQSELGLPMVGSFDLYAAEAGLLTAVHVADRYVAAGMGAVLVIGAESDNQLVDLPGQGGTHRARAGAAAVLKRSDGDAGILATVVGGAAQSNHALHDKVLLRGLSAAVEDGLRQVGLALQDIDLVIGEQTAPEVMRAWARATGMPGDRLVLDPDRYRPAFATAPFVALHDALNEGRLRAGQNALLMSGGRGPAWAVVLLRWGTPGTA